MKNVYLTSNMQGKVSIKIFILGKNVDTGKMFICIEQKYPT